MKHSHQWSRTNDALALMEGCTDEVLALMIVGRRQWQRQSEGCTGDALAMMEGCTNEAFALMIVRRRQWQKEVRRMHG